MGSGITILSMFISSVFLLERRGKVLYFDISDFRRSHYGFNVSARSCCFSLNELFGVTYRGSAEGLTSNERSVALTLFKALVLSSHRRPGGEQSCGHCGKETCLGSNLDFRIKE
jgi:hypothetical protein